MRLLALNDLQGVGWGPGALAWQQAAFHEIRDDSLVKCYCSAVSGGVGAQL